MSKLKLLFLSDFPTTIIIRQDFIVVDKNMHSYLSFIIVRMFMHLYKRMFIQSLKHCIGVFKDFQTFSKSPLLSLTT